ncbi:trypsin-like peptidase domain-containing protein [Streptomyces sp. NPDC052225]|uniref:trypsin-like peptidase domain-containing protein n=1 Tax=Streptomyces sp. NPDC052225 TaxID=3154949 RepID=UPI0034430700
MTTTPQDVRPERDTWVAAIHGAELDMRPLGSGVLVDSRRVLTCAHVVRTAWNAGGALWVALPKAEEAVGHRIKVTEVFLPSGGAPEVQDVAVLRLAEEVPEALAARLAPVAPGDLVGTAWWSFGFPEGVLGNSASGRVGEALGHGWVRLDTHGTRYPVSGGYSGAGVWSEAHQAVVGLVGQAHRSTGDALAITVWETGRLLPDQQLGALAVGAPASAAWSWSLDTDPESARHWRPRARGVSTDTEQGFRFRGRTAVLREITASITAATPRRQVLVVTGAPGSGKSAVLSRVVTTADPGIAASLPPDDVALRAPEGSVACAVHAKDKTALEIAQEIARAASVPPPDQVVDLLPALREALRDRAGQGFTLVVDALDEAASPAEARSVVRHVVVPLAETCADVGARLVVGARKRDAAGDLLGAFGPSARVLDLDAPELSDRSDLVAYALATLQLRGDERAGNPYLDETVALPVAGRIAEIADGSFLVAGLVARAHGMHDAQAVDPDTVSFPVTVETSLREYLRRLPLIGGLSAENLLVPLAYSEHPGLTAPLWRAALHALFGAAPAEGELLAFARTSAANFLVETDGSEGRGITFRLFHQALNEALRAVRADLAVLASDERSVALALLAEGAREGWADAPAYLLRSLATHAERGGVIDRLLCEDDYLLHADLRRLIPKARRAVTDEGRTRAALLRRTPRAIDASPLERAALFSVTEVQENLGSTYRSSRFAAAPYQALWSTVPPSSWEVATFEGHTGHSESLCVLHAAQGTLLASAGNGAIRLWDVATGDAVRTLTGHSGWIGALCEVTVEGRDLLAAGGSDGCVRLWDPGTGDLVREWQGAGGAIHNLCTIDLSGGPHLVIVDGHQRLTVRDARTGKKHTAFRTRTHRISGVCAFELDGRPVLAIGIHHTDKDNRVRSDRIRVWDPETGTTVRTFSTYSSEMVARSVVAVPSSDGPLLATNYGDDVLLLDPRNGACEGVLDGAEGMLWTLGVVPGPNGPLLAAGYSNDDEGNIVVWDVETEVLTHRLEAHSEWVGDLCAVAADGEWLLASAGADRTVRLWDLDRRPATSQCDGAGKWVGSLSVLSVGGRMVVADNGLRGAVRIHDVETGELVGQVRTPHEHVRGLCAVPVGGRTLLAVTSSSQDDGALQIWDPSSQKVVRQWSGPSCWNVQPLEVDGTTCLAVAYRQEDTERIMIQNALSGETVQDIDTGRKSMTSGLCTVRVAGRLALAILQDDWSTDSGTVTVWDVGRSNVVGSWEIPGAGLGHLCEVETRLGPALAVKRQVRTTEEDTSGIGSVSFHDPATGRTLLARELHSGWVDSIGRVELGHRALLATAAQTARCVGLWTVDGLRPVAEVPVRREVHSVVQASGHLILGLDQGLMAVHVTTS